MDWTLEVVILPVSDIDRVDRVLSRQGRLRPRPRHEERAHARRAADAARLGLLDRFGDLPSQREMAPGSIKGLQLVVADAAAAREELVGRGVECSEIMVFDERDGGTFFGFGDPDGNTWAVQQLKVRGEKPLIPLEHRGRFGEGREG